MRTSHVLQNSRLSSTAHHCLRLSLLPTAPRIATFLRFSNDLRFNRIPGLHIRDCKHPDSSAALRTRSSSMSVLSRIYETRVPSFSFRCSVPVVRASMETTTAASADAKPEVPKSDPIVQYIVLRKDLMEALKWPLGSVIAQGCHAAVAAVILHKDDPSTAEYCGVENLDNMHTVTLEVKGEPQLRNLAQKLEAGGVAHKLWIEQPENFPTCLATRPYRKSEVASFFKSLKLCK